MYVAANPVNATDPSGESWILNITIATALRGAIAATTMGTINAAWTYARGATVGQALWSGFKTGALTFFAFVSPLFAWSLLAASPILIGLGIYSGDLIGKDVPEIASYIAAGVALQLLFKTPAYSTFEVKTALRLKTPQAINNLKTGTSANSARNQKWKTAVKKNNKAAQGSLIHAELADLMKAQKMSNLKIEVSYDAEGAPTTYAEKGSVRLDYEVTSGGKTVRVVDLKPNDVIRGSWIRKVASRLQIDEELIEAFSYGNIANGKHQLAFVE